MSKKLTGISDEQFTQGFEILLETLPRILSEPEGVSESESILISSMVNDLGKLPSNQLASMLALAMIRTTEARSALIVALAIFKRALKDRGDLRDQLFELTTVQKIEIERNALSASLRAMRAAHTRHNRPGGAREKHRLICEVWASGKYTSRDDCAKEEAAALDMSFSAARKALRNTPDPA